MSQTVEAVIDKEGNVQLLEAIRLVEARRALVTILDDAPADEAALELGYQQMGQDEEREAEAHEWAEATIGDVADEPR
ncbi:MAG: hypothetical protein QOH42_1746 [Blastocatellia bacterium]|jgi:hypothetical protein|nr:hypothetical protein [Blastocatellia bacterium]